MKITRLYPGGKQKAFNISYDDGVVQDIRFVELLNQYGLKGTFNLNSQLMRDGFVWTHECGMEIKRLTEDAAEKLYVNHEVASHTLTHPYMHELSEEEILYQMVTDRENLQAMTGKAVAGFAVPFTYYSDRIARCAQMAGFEYARISEEGQTFAPCRNWYYWKAGVLHWSEWMMDFVDEFLYTREELAVCQIAGHSYDLDVMNMWDTMETICRKVSRNDEIWPATNLELVRYLKAMDQAEITAVSVANRSDQTLWFLIDGKTVKLEPGGRYDEKP